MTFIVELGQLGQTPRVTWLNVTAKEMIDITVNHMEPNEVVTISEFVEAEFDEDSIKWEGEEQ